MSQEYKFNSYYDSQEADITKDFFIPALKQSKFYYRSVGYFRSSGLLNLLEGLDNIILNDGKLKYIISHVISKDDFNAINNTDKYVKDDFISSFENIKNENIDKYVLLVNLLYYEILEFKICVSNDSKHIFHKKEALFLDDKNNGYAIIGSCNESSNAQYHNFESFSVFNSERDNTHFKNIYNTFKTLWTTNKYGNFYVLSLNEKTKKFISTEVDSYPKPEIIQQYLNPNRLNKVKHPREIYDLRDYQIKAVKNWFDNNCNGIFEMATGTGKTITSLLALYQRYVSSYENSKKLFVVITVPLTHLIDQWVEDLEKFNFRYLNISSSHKEDYLDHKVNTFLSRKNTLPLIVMTLFDSFDKSRMNSIFDKIGKYEHIDKMIICDEAHNLGGSNRMTMLLEKESFFDYKLALSATIIHYKDESRTKRLFNYFKTDINKTNGLYRYSLRKAIKNKKLTPYHYIPKFVELSNENQEKYNNLVDKYNDLKNSIDKTRAMKEIYQFIEDLDDRLVKFIETYEPYSRQYNNLIFCGARTKYKNGNNEIKQLKKVQDILGNKFKVFNDSITYEVPNDQRQEIIKQFENKELQALIAIKCLDEGVSIKSIERAFILQSSANPAEFVQRRGRVLRLKEGKDYAEIFDFVALPNPDDCYNKKNLMILERELNRMYEYSTSAINENEIIDKINNIVDDYKSKGVNIDYKVIEWEEIDDE